MGGRGSSGGGRSLSSIGNSMKRTSLIRDAISYGGTSPFESSYWVSNLKNEIGRALFNGGREGTTKEINSIASSLESYVSKQRKKRK